MKSITPLTILILRQLMQACQELANTIVSFSGKRREKNAEISLGKIFCVRFHLCWGQSGSDLSLNLIWVDSIYTEKKKIKVPQQIIWKEVDTIYLTHLVCHLQGCLGLTSCINQGKVVETTFYPELSEFLYKICPKINIWWWSPVGKRISFSDRARWPQEQDGSQECVDGGRTHIFIFKF